MTPFSRRIVGGLLAGGAAVVVLGAFGSSALLDLQMTGPDQRDNIAGEMKNRFAGKTIAFAKIPWFYSPPLSPLFGAPSAAVRARAAQQATAYDLIMPKTEWDASVLSPAPDFFLISDLESANALHRLHTPAAVHFMQALEAAHLTKIGETFTDPAFGVSPFAPDVWNAPEDMRYATPGIALYKKN